MAEAFIGTLIDPERPRFDDVPGYLPIVGGVRHLSPSVVPLPHGTPAETLCGVTYVEPRRPRRESLFDCRWCTLELLGLEPPRSFPYKSLHR